MADHDYTDRINRVRASVLHRSKTGRESTVSRSPQASARKRAASICAPVVQDRCRELGHLARGGWPRRQSRTLAVLAEARPSAPLVALVLVRAYPQGGGERFDNPSGVAACHAFAATSKSAGPRLNITAVSPCGE